ncbi:histidinol-phosphate transaminase [Coralloluteibacterium thermophilus]|uniref:Histidinol-phosphate aminotransferase n=1 Tax=Coralloluteibacterium thermophilum TaxID=2707049 RepID=A0ABV9NKM9_9GAMM
MSVAVELFERLATPAVRALRAYDPGHDLVALRARFAPAALVELGANENAYGPSPAARAAVLDVLNTLHRYPDPTGAALKARIARAQELDPAGVVLGNGSHELLMLIAQAFATPGTEVVASRYGFAVYALAAQAVGATLRLADALPPAHAMPLGHDLDALAAAVGPMTRIVYLANPNNPTGTWFPRAALERFLGRVPGEVLVVVDEAYAEFVDDPAAGSAVPLLAAHPNLVVTRTFSKAYALAGLRVGYALAHPQLAAVLERLRESFNVNSAAQAAALAALDDDAHLAWVVERNAEERAALAAALSARGLRVLPSQTNFLLVDFGRDTAALEPRLVAQGVVVRPVGGYGLPHCLRISVGTRDENRRLLAVLDGVLA